MRSLTLCAWIVAFVSTACSSAERAPEVRASLPTKLLRAPMDDMAGRPVVIADELATGKKVALVFWQSWCSSCRREAPELVEASRKYPGIEIIGVVPGPDEDVDEAELERTIRDLGLPYRSVRDRDLTLTRALDVTGTPTIVVLDATGRILYQGHTVPEWESFL